MYNIKVLVILLVVFFLGHGCLQEKANTAFLIESHTPEIQLDGIIEESEWSVASILTNLHSPWVPEKLDSTIFRCYISENYFNFCFEVVDRTITVLKYEDEMSVAKGGRVELFFSSTSNLSRYYCMEINPYGHVLDYKAEFYRNFDNIWNFIDLAINSTLTHNGYIVEGRIPILELNKLDIDLSNGFYFGVFRADFTEENKDSVIWHTWQKPISKEPDFHISSAFGKSKIND